MKIYDTLLLSNPTPRGNDFNNFEQALCQDAAMNILTFPAQWFLRRFLKTFAVHLHVKLLSPIAPS
jgi:hypothetical protein